jgi:hypothetical protein
MAVCFLIRTRACEASGSQYRREANAVSTRGARRVNVILSGRQKGVSLRRKKRYTTQTPGTERAGLATRFSPPKGLIFHFGWERRRIESHIRGSVSAANE